jgi:hypothetical protein
VPHSSEAVPHSSEVVPHLEFDFRCEFVFNRPIHPPLGDTKVLSNGVALQEH